MCLEQVSNVIEVRPEQMPVAGLRLADPEDFSQVRKLNLAALELDLSAFGPQAPERKGWMDEDWQTSIEEGNIQIGVNEKWEFVAMADTKKKQESVWQLHTVFVDPAHRKNIDTDEAGWRLSERLIRELIDTVQRERATEMTPIVNQTKSARWNSISDSALELPKSYLTSPPPMEKCIINSLCRNGSFPRGMMLFLSPNL